MKLKKIITATLLSISLATPIQANFWGDIFGEVTKYFDISGFEAGNWWEGIIGEGLNALAGTAGADGVMETCYVYNPRAWDSKIEIDLCGVLDKLPNLCESAPDLGAFGYTKKTFDWNIKDACTKLVEDKLEISIGDYLGGFNTNIDLFNMETDNKSSIYGGKLKYGFKDTENKHYLQAMLDGDHETLTVYNNIMNTTGTTSPDDIDISMLNVAYETIEDYTNSVQERVDTFRMLKDQLNISRVKSIAYKRMLSINEEKKLTTDENSQLEREETKIGAIGKMLEDYKEIVDKQVKMNVKERMLLEYKPGVLDPTKNTVKRFQKEDRARVVFVIEKQKAIQAKIYREEMEKGDKLIKAADREMHRVMYATEELNEEMTMEKIQELIKTEE